MHTIHLDSLMYDEKGQNWTTIVLKFVSKNWKSIINYNMSKE